METIANLKEQKYSLLSPTSSSLDSEETRNDIETVLYHERSRFSIRRLIQAQLINTNIAISWFIGSVLLFAAAIIEMNTRPLESQLAYSPAKEALRYKMITMTNGFDQRTEFQGPPSPSVDRAWQQSYSFLNRIPESQAIHLEPSTAEIHGDPGNYVVTIEVFHSLHCLDELRKTIWPEYYGTLEERYNVSRELATMHQDHCVEALREAIMCGGDITPHSWQYVPGTDHITAKGVGQHSCRDFDAIKKWAIENSMSGNWAPVGLEGQFKDNRWKAGKQD
ncbi:hypothetical protein F5Y16DRAFT_403601 [Xylariaceae sp. FL0255]|nr:hypothetical protein F5Y16DRAFT_403601 [Xylariaceae sp. FL0255]